MCGISIYVREHLFIYVCVITCTPRSDRGGGGGYGGGGGGYGGGGM
jgi:hypothetical protein